jgi:hypothetical protein
VLFCFWKSVNSCCHFLSYKLQYTMTTWHIVINLFPIWSPVLGDHNTGILVLCTILVYKNIPVLYSSTSSSSSIVPVLLNIYIYWNTVKNWSTNLVLNCIYGQLLTALCGSHATIVFLWVDAVWRHFSSSQYSSKCKCLTILEQYYYYY